MSISDEIDRLAELHRGGTLDAAEFAAAKARLLQDGQSAADPVMAAINALRRSRSERWIAGVCGGLAEATGLDAWVWRLIFAALAVCGGAGVVIYLLMWIFVPAGRQG